MASASHDERITAALAQIRTILIPGESIEAVAVQLRLFALVNRRALVVATTARLIATTRGVFGGFTPHDIQWQDLVDARLDVGIFGARLTLRTTGQSGSVASLRFEGLDKESAQDVYRICQAQEQSWREKRRIRELEEMRAKSGGVHLGSAGTSVDTSAPATESPSERLERAKAMLDKGLISDAEFETIKARVINSL